MFRLPPNFDCDVTAPSLPNSSCETSESPQLQVVKQGQFNSGSDLQMAQLLNQVQLNMLRQNNPETVLNQVQEFLSTSFAGQKSSAAGDPTSKN
ncbi:hypothetical protein L596_001143 [Steinernema carpocapsae]|uniref:Uncharacterized protein n=1 Tax=Steinernema carpocapsae TaxID=34508 RepID=A0A4U8ULF8_STECR|nr:hypothetical protein L596_001143 [Steinernema carpocapsae]